MGFFAWLFRLKPKKIKLGLALGSGGAKGYAHLGALRAFEENGIEFDVIAGTSIGSIIGAAYADGYTSNDISGLLGNLGIGDLASAVLATNGLQKVIDDALGGTNIEELKKPFVAIATEVDEGDEFVFSSGSVSLALAASSSMPPYFKPVVVGNKRYIDGAFTNSVPADRVTELGADYVVGIDLSSHEAPAGLVKRFYPTFKNKTDTPWEKGYEYSDVMLHPDLAAEGLTAVSFKEKDRAKMYDLGYRAAMDVMPKILADIRDLKSGKKRPKSKRLK